MADYFAGDGATVGQFGKPQTLIELHTLNPEFWFAELGDIIVFDSEFNTYIDAFNATLSGIYFMVVELQKDLNDIKLKLLEVG